MPIGSSGSLATRRERLSLLRALDDYMLAETQVGMVKEEALSFLFQLEIFEEVPGLGAVTGGALNLTFMQRVEVTARRVFQERWLLDTGKIESELVPSDVPARQLAAGWSGGMGRTLYGGCYYAGFGASLPFYATAALMPPMDNALTRSVRDGARAALTAVGLTRANERRAIGSSPPIRGEAVPALL